MSILSLRPGRTERQERIEPTPVPYTPRPKPVPPGPHQLGSVTLQNVDQLTSMSAEEIDKVADQVLDAAQETADVLREAARRVRHSGTIANERLANFVRVASTCADAAKMMQQSVALRNEPQPEPAAGTSAEPADDAAKPATVDLEAISEKIATAAEPAP